MLSADISGFTALSERLADRGRAGAEQLTDLINTCFTNLIAAAERHGGEVLKFGGDAILVLFRSPDHVLRAAAAGHEMQQSLARLGAARRAGLTMTVGIHNGAFDVYLVGSDHREMLVTGADASEVIRLEGDAAKGATLVSSTLAAALPDDLTEPLEPGASDHLLVDGPTGLDRLTVPASTNSDYRNLVVGNVAVEIATVDRLGGEHRVVAVGFVLVQGVRASVATRGFQATADALGDLVDHLHQVCGDYDVTPLNSDIADDGIKYVVSAGAPVGTGSIADGLVLAARDIAAFDTPFVVRQGLQVGRCFAGFLGADHRRAYTIMGDPVNTAARMLGPATDRDVIAVEDLLSTTRAVYLTEPLPPLSVKGKAEPISAAKVLGTSTEVRTGRHQGPLVGRELEVATIDEAVERGHGFVEFVGSAGLGKSRLLALAESEATQRTRPVYRAAAHPYTVGKPYGIVGDLLDKVLDIEPDADATRRGSLLRRALTSRAPALLDDLAALAIPLAADVPQTGDFESLEIGFRRAVVNRAITALLSTLYPDGVVLIIEDLHWSDDASGDALRHLARQAMNGGLTVLAFTTRRDEGLFSFDEVADDVTTIALSELGDDAIIEIANRAATRPLSDHELASVARRASGNPLFAVEVAEAISESTDGEVPDSVESVIAGRIDRAPPEARRMLRILSVWGDEFEAAEVAPVMNEFGAPTDLAAVDMAGVVEELRPGVWGFTHALHREVAYAGLAYKRRREYHRAIGNHLEERAGDPLAIAGILSIHYDRGGEYDRAWLYCREAGDQAARQLAQIEALDAFERALAAGRHIDVPNADLADTAVKLGDAAEHAGRYDVARRAYRTARRLVPPEDRAYLSTFRKLGIIDEREGRYSQAQRWYRRGMKAALAARPRPDRGEWLLLTVSTGGVEIRRGRPKAAWDILTPIADDRRAPADVRLRASVAAHLAGTYLNKPEATRYGEIGLELVGMVRDPVLHGNLVNNLGIAQYFSGNWDAAADLYEESYRLRDGAGDVLGAVMALNNLGEIRSDQLRFDEARRLFDDGLRRGRAANTTLIIHVLEANFGRLATRTGDFDEADELLSAALDGFKRIESAPFVADTELRVAELLSARGDHDQASAVAERLLLAAAGRGAGAAETVPLIRIRAAAALAAGRRSEAAALLHEALQAATEENIRYQRAGTLRELAVLEPDAGHLDAARMLLDALGVVDVEQHR
jgi:class 3 adenylate cyclase/tetratricopeptide (TPR) repeat protein